MEEDLQEQRRSNSQELVTTRSKEQDLQTEVDKLKKEARLMKENIDNINRFFTTKQRDEQKLQKILDTFKDKMTEKLRIISDDFTSKFMFQDKANRELEEKFFDL